MARDSISPFRVERYTVFGEIAAGGMATVHFGRLDGPGGFGRTVAVKRLHRHLARDPDLVMMLMDEARLAGRIRHPNVVPTLDAIAHDGEVLLILEYVDGVPLSLLLQRSGERDERIEPGVVAAIVSGALHGLHAAHEAVDEQGTPLGIVHRDISPSNILVGRDGIARVLDFGIAKAHGRLQTTQQGQVKGKLAYMSPEQLSGGAVDRRTDIFASSVVLWEALTGRRLFGGGSDGDLIGRVLRLLIEPPSKRAPGLDPQWDAVTLRGLARDPHDRYPTARTMALAVEGVTQLASTEIVGRWVEDLAIDVLEKRARRLAEARTGLPAAPSSGKSLGSEASVAPIADAATGIEPVVARSAWRRRRRTVIVGFVTLAMVCGFMITLRAWRGGAAPAPAVRSSATRPDPAASLFATTPSAVAPSAPPTGLGATEDAASPSSRAPSSKPTIATSPMPTSRSTGKAPAPVPAPACSPPYVLDAQGTRRYKLECL